MKVFSNSQLGKFFSILLCCLYLTGCSTMFGRHQDEQMVIFDSSVSGVDVNCSGKRVETPGSIPLRQSKSHSCTAKLDGYEKKVFRIRSGTSWAGFAHSTATNGALWGWWTLGIGVGIGWLIDFPSGAMRNLKEDSFYLDMKPVGSSSAAAKAVSSTVNVVKTAVEVPTDVVKNTATAVVGTTVHEGAENLGVDTSQEAEDRALDKDVSVV